MIDLNNRDTREYFKRLIDNEIANINITLHRQKELTAQIFKCINKFSINVSSDVSDESFSSASSELVNFSKLLDKMSYNCSALLDLLEDLENMKKSISVVDNKIITDIEEYNKTFTDRIKQISMNAVKTESFLAQNNVSTQTKTSIYDEIYQTLCSKDLLSVLSEERLKALTASTTISADTVNTNTEINNLNVSQLATSVIPTVQTAPTNATNTTENEVASVLTGTPVEQIAPFLPMVEEFDSTKESFTSTTVTTNANTKSTIDTVTSDAKTVDTSTDTKESSTEVVDTTTDLSDKGSDTLTPNTLVISELEGKVTLPYTIDELVQTLEENAPDYTSLEDVIDKLYTRPIKYYKHSSRARFKEAYNLIRKRQNGSVGEALDLATELFSNYNLHPAVITACKNLNELDIYLACLECNELDDFKFFKVEYRAFPLATRKSKVAKAVPAAKKAMASNSKQGVRKGRHV